jgi:hypothetical protein
MGRDDGSYTRESEHPYTWVMGESAVALLSCFGRGHVYQEKNHETIWNWKLALPKYLHGGERIKAVALKEAGQLLEIIADCIGRISFILLGLAGDCGPLLRPGERYSNAIAKLYLQAIDKWKGAAANMVGEVANGIVEAIEGNRVIIQELEIGFQFIEIVVVVYIDCISNI